MKELLNYLSKRGSFPALVTVLSGFIAALVIGGLSALDLLCLVGIVASQLFFQLHNKLYARMVPIERLSGQNELRSAKHYRNLNWGLAVTPLLFIIHPLAPWATLCFVFLIKGKEAFSLAKRYMKRNSLLESEINYLNELNPKLAVYVSGLANVAYQINQWLPVLETLDVEIIIIARQRSIFRGMRPTGLPIIHARNMRHVENVLECGVRTVLYPANTMQNIHALRHFRLNHYFINHGESDKAVNQNKLLLAYDKLLVGGPLAHRRLVEAGLGLRGGQIDYVGRPQAEMALAQIDPNLPRDVQTILYAPTWEGFVEDVNYSSVNNFGLELVNILISMGYQVIFKPHPYTGSRSSIARKYLGLISAECKALGMEVVDAMESIYSCMNRSDALITDISSVLNEYLVTRKPIVLCVTDRLKRADLETEFPSSKAAYQLEEPDKITELMSSISNGDPMAAQRELVRKDSLGDFPEGALARFKSVVSASLNDAV